MNARLHVGLPDFEGAMEELVGAVRAGEYAIASVPLREITERFLGYIKEAHANEVELGADYIDAASWLVLVKSRSLVPQEPEEPTDKRDQAHTDDAEQEEEQKRKPLSLDEARFAAELLRQHLLPPSLRGAAKPFDYGGTPASLSPAQTPTLADLIATAARHSKPRAPSPPWEISGRIPTPSQTSESGRSRS